MLTFSESQKSYIHQGAIGRKALKRSISQALSGENQKHPHVYLSGPPGIGKTYEVVKALREKKVLHIITAGAISTFAWGLDLMVAHFKKKEGEKLYVIVEDCDKLIENIEDLNILKNVLDGIRTFQRTKATPLNLLNELQRTIIPDYQSEDSLGYEVPCDDFIFVFTSNYNLPTSEDVRKHGETRGIGTPRHHILNSQTAIRDRCNTKNYSYDQWQISWGWIADSVLNDTVIPEINKDCKYIILEWMYNNWTKMSEHSIRTIEKMAQLMIDEGDDYKDFWESDFLI